MPERSLRRKIPVSNRRTTPPQPSPSPRRRTTAVARQSSKPSRPIEIVQRCNSEPNLVGGDEHRNLTTPDAVIFHPQACTDIFSSAESLPPHSPQKFEGYSKDSKVVVNVVVEGSPGPIRTMVRLGSSVEETIMLVINKYSEEGRSPQLHIVTASAFELHHSYFSLESLNKSDVIGDVGSRSFYLRKSINGGDCNCSSSSSSNGDMMVSAESLSSEIVSSSSSSRKITTPPSPLFFFRAFIARKIKFIIRKTCKFWRLLGCVACIVVDDE